MKNIHDEFVDRVISVAREDRTILGVAIGGSWISQEIDEFSDIDFVIVTEDIVSDSKSKMDEYAGKFGNLLNSFTGEHVGEPRLLVCMYDDPLIHVDYKFVVLDEFQHRVEDPVVVYDRDESLKEIITRTQSHWPEVDYQWLEDRFWTWVHYGALKIGRGELFEAIDFISFVRTNVLSQLLQLKYGNKARANRKLETFLSDDDLDKLKDTIGGNSRESIISALVSAIDFYRELREELFGENVQIRTKTEERCTSYLAEIKRRFLQDGS
jgi:hypothetical protein